MVGDSEKTYRFLSQIFLKSKTGELGRPIVIFVFPLFFHVMCKGTAIEIGRLIKEGLEKKFDTKHVCFTSCGVMVGEV